jgi:hypothetical protein
MITEWPTDQYSRQLESRAYEPLPTRGATIDRVTGLVAAVFRIWAGENPPEMAVARDMRRNLRRFPLGRPFGTAAALVPDGRCGGRGAAAWLTNYKGSALQTGPASSEDRSHSMTEPDDLTGEITALKALQRDAWRELASPSLTIFDRREIRNRVRQSESELRTYLKMMSERLRFRPRPVEEVGDSLANIDFRLLAGS